MTYAAVATQIPQVTPQPVMAQATPTPAPAQATSQPAPARAIPALTTSTITTPAASTTSTTATQTPSELAQVAPVTRKQKRRSTHSPAPYDKDQLKPDSMGESSDEDPGEGPSKADKGKDPSKADQGEGLAEAASTQEEESDAEVMVESFSMKALRNMRKDFSHHEGDWRVNVDLDGMPCKRPVLPKFVQSAPSVYSHTVSAMVWGGSDADASTVNEVANRVQQYEDSLSCPLTVAAVEKVAEKTEKMAEENEKMTEKMAKKNEKLFDTLVNCLGWRKNPTLPLQRSTSQALGDTVLL
ncbi:hypothetical protein llap_22457 [Limosa lapponica baueri]|uniref:Ubiquitin carboxyl-terminal hydrolase 4 n=1 Tax=Limosa lapponica baueri TaxID=1758121 RepID=A0A2I0T0C0_LIMLA|nr:hypothetical protein llap_22457 [Limosa lapponica baueri]